jgi:hypothetical protein
LNTKIATWAVDSKAVAAQGIEVRAARQECHVVTGR